MGQKNYSPVSCDFYDELEEMSTLRKEAEIVYRDDSGAARTVKSLIADLFTREHEEFVKLSDGTTIRLDRIRSVNGRDAGRFHVNQ